MNYTEILAFTESKLMPEYEYVVGEIKSRIASGSTGGEIGSLVGGYLNELRDQNHPAYLILKHEIDLYLSQFIFRTNMQHNPKTPPYS
jgi:hypothetical protein